MENIKDKLIGAFMHYTGEPEVNDALRIIAEKNNPDTTKPLEYKRNNLRRRLDNGKFSQDELKGFADMMGCEYISEFILSDGIRLSDGNEKYLKRTGQKHMDVKTMIDMLLIFSQMKKGDFLEKIGVTSGAFFMKMENEKLKMSELEGIAEIFGAEYKCRFVFDDGAEY